MRLNTSEWEPVKKSNNNDHDTHTLFLQKIWKPFKIIIKSINFLNPVKLYDVLLKYQWLLNCSKCSLKCVLDNYICYYYISSVGKSSEGETPWGRRLEERIDTQWLKPTSSHQNSKGSFLGHPKFWKHFKYSIE